MTLAQQYLDTVIRRVKYYKDLGDKTLALLTSEEINYQPNQTSNSVAIIIQHLSGNMLSRWTDFLTSDGEKHWRNRDEEFAVSGKSREQIIQLWENGWACFLNALASLKDDDLLKTIHIRDEGLLVIDAINRQLAHYPYHVGQIVYLGKMIKDTDWQSLSIAKGESEKYNQSAGPKDPAKRF